MTWRSDRKWFVAALVLWALGMAAIIGGVAYFRSRSTDILNALIETDPAANRRALRFRLEADRLVNRALQEHERQTSPTETARALNGPLVDEVRPLLEEAERLYLESLDEDSSQPGVLFHLVEVNALLGREKEAAEYMARYYEAQGETAMAEVFRNQSTQR